jgi:hypothetical protein
MQEDNTTQILKTFGATLFMIIVLWFMIWCYYYDGRLFVSFVSMLYLIYTIVHIVYVWLNKDSLSSETYNILFGSAIYMTVISFGIFILFIMKFFDIV